MLLQQEQFPLICCSSTGRRSHFFTVSKIQLVTKALDVISEAVMIPNVINMRGAPTTSNSWNSLKIESRKKVDRKSVYKLKRRLVVRTKKKSCSHNDFVLEYSLSIIYCRGRMCMLSVPMKFRVR